MKEFDYVGLGFVSNDHLAVLPFITIDTKVKMLSHAIIGGGPADNATAGAAALGLRAAFVGTVSDDADGRMFLGEFAREGADARRGRGLPRGARQGGFAESESDSLTRGGRRRGP